jgi:hypothetical protein
MFFLAGERFSELGSDLGNILKNYLITHRGKAGSSTKKGFELT